MNYALTSGATTFEVGTTAPLYVPAKKLWVTDVGHFADHTGKEYTVSGTNPDLSPVPAPHVGSVISSAKFLKLWTAQELAAISGLVLKSGVVENFFVGVVGQNDDVDMTDPTNQKLIRLTLNLLPTDVVPISQRVIRYNQILTTQTA